MKTTPLRIVGSTLNLFDQRTSRTLWTMIGMLLVATASSLTAQPAPPSAGGLVGHWNFDEGSGPVAADSSGFGNDGQLVEGTAWWQSQSLARVALSFDGVNDHVSVRNSPSLNPSDEITLAAWIAPYDVSTSGEIIAKSNGTDPQYYLRVQAGGKIRFGIGATVLNGNTTLSLSQWHQVAGTYDGSTMKIYVDGVLDAMMSKNGPMHDNGVDVWIGCRRFRTPLAFNGLIDDARIFSRALSANEIQSLVTPPQVVITSPPSGQTFLFEWWNQCPGCPPWFPIVGLTADVFNFSAPVTKVDFYEHSDLIGTATQTPYSVVYQNPLSPFIGQHDQIVAVATDTLGNTVSSDPNAFSFNVCGEYQAPYLTIISPARGLFAYGDPIYISLGFRDDCGARFADGIDLYDSSTFPPLLLGHLVPWMPSLDFIWQNAPVGSHHIVATSTSNNWLEDSVYVTVVDGSSPSVKITSPADRQIFDVGTTSITFQTAASDSDRFVAKVDFYVDGNRVGTTANAPFDFSWFATSPCVHELQVVATETTGVQTISGKVSFTIEDSHTETITSPAEGASFTVGQLILIMANSFWTCERPDRIEFYAFSPPSTSLFLDFAVVNACCDQAVYWRNATPGDYVLTARAIFGSNFVDSPGVHITVTP